MLKIPTALLWALCLVAASPADAQDNPKCELNPLFSRFPGERLESCDRSRFNSLDLRRRSEPGNPRSPVVNFKMEGEYWATHGPLAKDAQGRLPGKPEVVRNFENAVRDAKGEVLFVDEGGARVYFRINRPDGEF